MSDGERVFQESVTIRIPVEWKETIRKVGYDPKVDRPINWFFRQAIHQYFQNEFGIDLDNPKQKAGHGKV